MIREKTNEAASTEAKECFAGRRGVISEFLLWGNDAKSFYRINSDQKIDREFVLVEFGQKYVEKFMG